MSRSGDWWGRRSGAAKMAIIVALTIVTSALAMLTVSRSTGLGGGDESTSTGGEPAGKRAAMVETPCGRRARRVADYVVGKPGSSARTYQTLLHRLQRDCPGEANRAGLAGAFLPRCKSLAQSNCTLYRAPPWFRGSEPNGPTLVVRGAPARHGDYAVAGTASGEPGTTYLALQKNIRVNRFSPHMFSMYLRLVKTGQVSVKMQLACFGSDGKFTVNAQIANPRVLGPVSGVTAPTDGGFVSPTPEWARYGGVIPPRACPRGTRSVQPQFFLTYPKGSRAEVILDAVQLERGTRFTPYVEKGRNLVPDSSFESGGFAN